MTNWLKIFLPHKYAVIDGRRVTEPVISGSDTTFTVTGDSNWGSTSKYNVHLQGPNSYYLYKTLSEPKDDPSAGGARQEQITVTGTEPERLNRYRGYLNLLAPEDYKYWWQQIVSKACGGKVEKGEDGMKFNHYIYDKPLRKYEYNEPDYMNHYTPETDIDRTGTRPRYDAVTGRIHRTISFKVPEIKPNFAGLMAPGEVRQYIDPKTYRIQTITGPTDPHYRSAVYEYGDEHDESIRHRMKNNNGIFYLGSTDWEEPGYDVITWPDGSQRVILTSAQSKIYIPKGDYQIPSNPNDNTLTSGSIEKGNIKGGVYPGIEEPIQVPKGYNPTGEWEETHDQVNGGVRKTWKNKETGRVTRVNPNKVQKGDNGMVAGEFPPTWNQGEIRQGFQKARPDWMKKFGDWAERTSATLNKSPFTAYTVAPVFDYVTGLADPETGYAAILPAGKAVKIANATKKAALKESARLNKLIEHAFQERGLREAMTRWDAEMLANADRNVINNKATSWIDEFNIDNTSRINKLDLSNLINGSKEPSWLGGLVIGSGLGTVGGGMYLLNKENQKKKAEQKAKDATKKNKDKQ